MSTRQFDNIIEHYLDRVAGQLRDLPPAERAGILDDLRTHVEDAIRESGATTETEVRNFLDRLGPPEELARDAKERLGVEATPGAPVYRRLKSGPGALEVAAIILTAIVWPIGVLLAWVSQRWRTRDKVIGTVIPVFGFLLMMSMIIPVTFGGAAYVTSVDETIVQPAAPAPGVDQPDSRQAEPRDPSIIASSSSSLADAIGRIVVALAFIFGIVGAPFISAVYFAFRLQPAEEALYPDGTRIERDLPSGEPA